MRAGRFRLDVVASVLLLSAAPSTAEPKEALDIYVLRGDASQLERFQSEIGKGWQGGKFLDPLSSSTEHRYWAYSTRTARQAREFMFGAMNFPLQFDIETYGQATYYPKERKQLDGIARDCGASADAFFVQPDKTLLLKPSRDEKFQVVDCLLTEVRKANLIKEMPVGFVGNEAPAEVVK